MRKTLIIKNVQIIHILINLKIISRSLNLKYLYILLKEIVLRLLDLLLWSC